MPPTATNPKTETALPRRNSIDFFRVVLAKWGGENFARFPWRNTRNSFHALVAEVMLQRTRAEQAVPVYKEFARRFPSPSSAVQANSRTFLRLLKPLGLAWRARSLRTLVKVVAKNGGSVPHSFDELKELPGVGDYAAAAFSIFHLDKPATLIDSNIVRLYGRFFGLATGPETRRNKQFRLLAHRVQPTSNARSFAYALLDFTRSVCTPRPRCNICPLRKTCHYAKAQSAER